MLEGSALQAGVPMPVTVQGPKETQEMVLKVQFLGP